MKMNPCPRCRGTKAYMIYTEAIGERNASFRGYCPDCHFRGQSISVDEDPKTPYCLRRNAEMAMAHAVECWNYGSFPPWKMVIPDTTTIEPGPIYEEVFDGHDAERHEDGQ